MINELPSSQQESLKTHEQPIIEFSYPTIPSWRDYLQKAGIDNNKEISDKLLYQLDIQYQLERNEKMFKFQTTLLAEIDKAYSGFYGKGTLTYDRSTQTTLRTITFQGYNCKQKEMHTKGFKNIGSSSNAHKKTLESNLELYGTSWIPVFFKDSLNNNSNYGLIGNNTIIQKDAIDFYINSVNKYYEDEDVLFVDNFISQKVIEKGAPLIGPVSQEINRYTIYIANQEYDIEAENNLYDEYIEYFNNLIGPMNGIYFSSDHSIPSPKGKIELTPLNTALPKWFLDKLDLPAKDFIIPLTMEIITPITYPHGDDGIFMLPDGRLALIEFTEINCIRLEAKVNVLGVYQNFNVHEITIGEFIQKIAKATKKDFIKITEEEQEILGDALMKVRLGITTEDYYNNLDASRPSFF